MKGLSLFIATLIIMVLITACGSSKQASAYNYPQPDYHGQPQTQTSQRTATSTPQQPTRQEREVDKCITLANTEDNDKYRAYGTATSFQEEYALQNAEANAVTDMIQRMKTAVEGARQFYNKNANVNEKKITEGDAQSFINQYVVGECKDYKVIKTSMYDLSDGSIQCYVCIELRKTKEKVLENMDNSLSRDKLLEIAFDKQQFMKSIQQGLENYKRQQSQE